MSSLIRVEQPRISIGDLREKIEGQSNPVRRSTHIGNQPAHELVLMNSMPKGIDILMVDTIQGNDSYSMPKMVRLSDGYSIPLCRKRNASGRVVGSIGVELGCLPKNAGLSCSPEEGESLADFHSRAIESMNPANRPTPMMSYFGEHKEMLLAVMAACHDVRGISRKVSVDNLIEASDNIGIEADGVFGLEDATPATQGAMIPLNGMMALDVAISSLGLGSDKTTHLAGPHMPSYTRDIRRMSEVGVLVSKAAAELGVQALSHCYEVIDITGLSRVVAPATHASQHQLLISGDVPVDLDSFDKFPSGSI